MSTTIRREIKAILTETSPGVWEYVDTVVETDETKEINHGKLPYVASHVCTPTTRTDGGDVGTTVTYDRASGLIQKL